MKINKYLPFALIYFFLNAVALPFGVLYTIILTPLFYAWIIHKGKKYVILKFLLFFAPFIVIHLMNGVDVFYYFRSVALFFTVYIFCYAFYTLITTYDDMGSIFKKVALINFILTLLALLFVLSPYRNLFWSDWSIEVNNLAVNKWPRLVMFTYEPSYYSTLLVPIFAFYFVRFILRQLDKNIFSTMVMVVLPLVLSFSMGVISGLIVSIFILFILNTSKFLSQKRILYSFSIMGIVSALAIVMLFVFYPQNPFFVRVIAIAAGEDGSANGRTYQAFHLGAIIAEQRSIWWGVGFGQLKIIGDPIIKAFYQYPPDYGQVSIPCTAAETLALTGIVGLTIRILVEIYFFFKTKVLSNYYRTLLFFYIFVYQFTGSFTTNIAEYVIWILAFTNIFPQFDKYTNRQKDLQQT